MTKKTIFSAVRPTSTFERTAEINFVNKAHSIDNSYKTNERQINFVSHGLSIHNKVIQRIAKNFELLP